VGIVVGPPSPIKRRPRAKVLTGPREGAGGKKTGLVSAFAEQVDVATALRGQRCRATGRELLPGTRAPPKPGDPRLLE